MPSEGNPLLLDTKYILIATGSRPRRPDNIPFDGWRVVDGDGKAEVVFSHLATAQGATPEYKGDTCSSTYCHGATLRGGTHKDPSWRESGRKASRCGSCHALNPHSEGKLDCKECHQTTILKGFKILPKGTHINGTIDVGGPNSHINGGN